MPQTKEIVKYESYISLSVAFAFKLPYKIIILFY